jgi:hypothetical protein
MQGDATFNGYEFEIGKTIDLQSASITLSYARDSVIGEFDNGGDVPRIVPSRNLYSVSYAGNSIDAMLTLKDVEKQTKRSNQWHRYRRIPDVRFLVNESLCICAKADPQRVDLWQQSSRRSGQKPYFVRKRRSAVAG